MRAHSRAPLRQQGYIPIPLPSTTRKSIQPYSLPPTGYPDAKVDADLGRASADIARALCIGDRGVVADEGRCGDRRRKRVADARAEGDPRAAIVVAVKREVRQIVADPVGP